jgi:hypothetical protein
MDNPQGKILKDFIPTPPTPQGVVKIDTGSGYEPEPYNPFGSQRSSDQSAEEQADAVEVSGPFCKVYQDAPNWKLLGGTVTGGSGNVVVADINLGTISSPPANGTFYWLVCSGTAVVEDGVLLPGFTLSTVTVASGASIPSNTIPTAAASTGLLRISLGSWSNGVFVPAGCGNIQVNHCPGTLSYSRG